jgi:hypothetical protein
VQHCVYNYYTQLYTCCQPCTAGYLVCTHNNTRSVPVKTWEYVSNMMSLPCRALQHITADITGFAAVRTWNSHWHTLNCGISVMLSGVYSGLFEYTVHCAPYSGLFRAVLMVWYGVNLPSVLWAEYPLMCWKSGWIHMVYQGSTGF